MKSVATSLHRRSWHQGFTLIEVLLTSALVSGGALVILGVLASGLNASRSGLQGAQAAIIARGVIQDLRTGGLWEEPASEDERLTADLRPNQGLDFNRQVLLLDAAGLPLEEQPSTSQAEGLYTSGSSDQQAIWLVSIQGSVAPYDLSSGGQGQVQPGVNLQSFAALSINQASTNLLATAASSDPAPLLAPTQVTILIEFPAAAQKEARQRYRFVELWNR